MFLFKFTNWMTNCVDPDQIWSGSTLFAKVGLSWTAGYGLRYIVNYSLENYFNDHVVDCWLCYVWCAKYKRVSPVYYAPRRISGEHIVAAASVRPCVHASVRPCVRASVRPSRSCPRKFSETACRISMKLHGNIKYQRWMRISPACSGSMIFPRVIALWWVLHEYIGYCSCPREFSETTSRISLKLHGNIKYGRWMCISPACSGSMIFPRVIALWWVLHEYIGYCSCPRKFLANTGRNSTKF